MEEMIMEWISGLMPVLLKLGGIGIGYFLIKKMFKQLVERYLKKVLNNEYDVSAIILKAGNIAILVMTVIIGLSTMGINMAGLIAGLGLGGFALGFALKDSVSNLLSGILVLIYKPFSIGDTVTVGKHEGIVKSIDLRYTTLSGDDETYLIPNKKIFSDSIIISNKVEAGETISGDDKELVGKTL